MEIAGVLLGVVVGLVSTILGLGGGVLLVPTLPLLFSLSQKEAVATSLVSVLVIVLFNSYNFHRRKLVAWPLALAAGPLVALSSFVSGRVAYTMDNRVLLSIFVGVFVLIFLRLLMPIKPRVSGALSFWQYAILGLLALAAGALSGVAGVGAGILLTPALLIFSLVRNEQLAPTANGIMIFNTSFALLGFLSHYAQWTYQDWQWGPIHYGLALSVLVGALPMAFYLRQRQAHVPEVYRRRGLAAIVFVLFAMSLYRLC